MDALISIPLLSYLVIPSFGAYSTSLNLLFFYMTWSTLVLSHKALHVEVIGSLAIRILFFRRCELEKSGTPALPTRTVGKKRKKRSAITAAKKGSPWWLVIAVSLGNLILGAVVQAAIETAFVKVLKWKTPIRVTTTLPLPWNMAKDIGRGFLCREVLQYYLHRFLLHSNTPLLTGWHESWNHDVSAPYSFVAHYDHPLPWLLWRFLPIYVPALLFKFHLLTYFLFLALSSLEESLTFSGYYNMPGIMLGGVTRRQDLHMETRGLGNFGAWGLLDWCHGTSAGGDIEEDVRDELDKHDVPERAEAALAGARAKGRDMLRKKGRR